MKSGSRAATASTGTASSRLPLMKMLTVHVPKIVRIAGMFHVQYAVHHLRITELLKFRTDVVSALFAMVANLLLLPSLFLIFGRRDAASVAQARPA